jgi:hypothetical protein
MVTGMMTSTVAMVMVCIVLAIRRLMVAIMMEMSGGIVSVGLAAWRMEMSGGIVSVGLAAWRMEMSLGVVTRRVTSWIVTRRVTSRIVTRRVTLWVVAGIAGNARTRTPRVA